MKKSADTSTNFDPVCGMTVNNFSIRPIVVCQGIKYSFCSEGCRKAFMANPQRYLNPKVRERKERIEHHLGLVTRATAKSGWEGRPLTRRI